jgi:iron(III) transport system substrate-binding protein
VVPIAIHGLRLRLIVSGLVSLQLMACSAGAATPTSAPAQPAATQPPAAAKQAPSAPADAGTARMQELYEKARASGEMKVVMYSAGPEYGPVFDVFKQRYPGVEVEGVVLRGPEMIQRFTAESSSRRIANVAGTGATTMSTIEAQGLLAEWEGPPTAAELPSIPLTNGKTRWPYLQNTHGFVVNTDLVPAGKIPNTRQDILQPFFKGKGKLLVDDPRGGGPGIELFTWTYDQLGQAYFDALKAQDITFIRERDAAPAQIARGEYAMFFPVAITGVEMDLQRNSPLKVGWFKDGGAMIVSLNLGVVKDAPGQDVAKLFVSWITSAEGQKAIVEKLITYPALPGVSPPAGWPTLQEINPSHRTDDQIKRNNDYIQLADQLFFK